MSDLPAPQTGAYRDALQKTSWAGVGPLPSPGTDAYSSAVGERSGGSHRVTQSRMYDQTAHNQPRKLSKMGKGGGVVLVPRTPERDAQLHADNPDLMDTWLRQGSRSDGGNG